MYSLAQYGTMMIDSLRMTAYVDAMQGAIGRDSVVVDIGAGTGIASLLACRFGARKVYAIEPSDAISVAERIARANGLADRITFIQDLSTRVVLPEQADVIVSDLRGALPLFQQHIPSLMDARARWLKPGGVLIPRRDTLWAAVVETPEAYDRMRKPWAQERYGLDMTPALEIVTNTWIKRRVTPNEVLSPAQCWATVDYASIQSPNVAGEVELRVSRPGTGHGLAVWFDATLMEGIGFSNAPGQPESVYDSAYFPWPAAVELEAGDGVAVRLRADLVGDDYVWGWDSTVLDRHSGNGTARFRQSTFHGMPLSAPQLRKRSGAYQGLLVEEGRIDGVILHLMDGSHSNEAIAHVLVDRFAGRFPSIGAALTRVANLAQKYSR